MPCHRYDAPDRLTSAVMPDGTNTLYRYDHAGRRTQESINSTVTHFLWNEISPYGDVIAEYDATSTPQAHYTLANGQLLAQTRGTNTHFYLQDGQMSVRMLTDEAGTVTDSYDYDAFGEIDAQTGSTMTIQYGGVAALGGLQTAEVYVSEAIVVGLSGLGGLTTLLTDKRGHGGNNDGNEDQNNAENDSNSEESGSRDDEPPGDLPRPV